jgi:hypothetical protein
MKAKYPRAENVKGGTKFQVKKICESQIVNI